MLLGKAQAADRAGWRRPATCPGLATMWYTVPTSTCHPEWRCVRRPTLDAVIGAVTRISESYVGPHGIRCLLVIISGASPPLSGTAFRAGLLRRRRRPLGSAYRRRGPSPRR